MASKLVAFRLPQDLIEAIEAEAAATGKDKTSIVTNGLRQVFHIPAKKAHPQELPECSASESVTPYREVACASVGSGIIRH
jgi:hypothetical protein